MSPTTERESRVALREAGTSSPANRSILGALELPNGARFYRCALQVNPFAYLRRSGRKAAFHDENAYNEAVIDACIKLGIEVIAVTDHYRVSESQGLIKRARERGLIVFPGFEAETKDGIHLLCLFDPATPQTKIDRHIGECGVCDDKTPSPAGKLDARELLEESRQWGTVCVAPHATSEKGILKSLDNQARIATWKHKNLVAVSVPDAVGDEPENLRLILENNNLEYRRDRPVAVVNSLDVSGPDDLEKAGASCWVKMSEVSVEGLRQAFLDPDSRIRLSSDPKPEPHANFVAIAWEGGFLDGGAIHFNENLNVLVGGRGAGKSTVVESLRYVLQLDAIGDDARKAHESIVRQVLGSGTKVSLLVTSHRPAHREYLLERTVPNPPTVRDMDGNVLPLMPRDVLPGVELYGQREISELLKSREKLTRLLDRFTEPDPELRARTDHVRRQLEGSRRRLVEVRTELRRIEERLAALPAVQETLRSYEKAGLEAKLKEQSLLVREERLFRSADERLGPFRELLESLQRNLPVDRAFVSAKSIAELPGRDLLGSLDQILARFNTTLTDLATRTERAIGTAEDEIRQVRAKWDDRKRAAQQAYETILRELQKFKINGEDFLALRRQLEELRPLQERAAALKRQEESELQTRRNLLAEWAEVKREGFRRLDSAAREVSRQLQGRVHVKVTADGDREPLFGLLKQVGGRLSEAIETLRKAPGLSLVELADACRSGREELVRRYSLTPTQAERLTQGGDEMCMRIEELDLPPTTSVQLNVAGEGQPVNWKELEDLSTGQKATAVLLLLLLEAEMPLVVDQPEDDLDNKFIADGIVPTMRNEKRRRQFLFTTHNANIPVLGDAELIVGLSASGEAGEGRGEMRKEHMASIDSGPVRQLVEEVLEGGRAAFETRRAKYGF